MGKTYWAAVLIGTLLAVMLFSNTQVASADPTELPTGGEGFDNAVTIEPGTYVTDHQIATGVHEYFKITINAGQKLNVKWITPATGYPYAGAAIYSADRVKLREDTIIGGANASDTIYWTAGSESSSYTLYILVGNDYDKNAVGVTYEISIENRFDANSGTDVGGNFGTALEITPGSYGGFLTPRWGDDDKDYFYVTNLKPGQRLTVNVEIQPDSPGPGGGITWTKLLFFDENRTELMPLSTHDFNSYNYEAGSITAFWTPSSRENSYSFYFELEEQGYGGLSYSMDVSVENYYDANSGTDAGHNFDTALSIAQGTYQGFLAGDAGDDHEDYYVIFVGSGQTLDVILTPASDASYGLEIYDQNRIQVASTSSANDGVITSTSWTAPFDQNAYVRITRGYQTGSRTYSLNLSVEGGEAPQNISGTNMYLSMNAPASMNQGNTMIYTLYYNNFGGVAASNVVLQAVLPSNADFVSASDNGTYDSATRRVTWNMGSVPAFPSGRGSRTIRVRILSSIPVGTVIQTTASISTSTLEIGYDDNTATAQTTVAESNLPPNVGVGPIRNSRGTPSVGWNTPITFTYHNPTAISVDIRIHLNDGGPNITGNMTGGPPEWTYTTSFYSRFGRATVTYMINDPTPYSDDFDLRSMRGFENSIEAGEINEYIQDYYNGAHIGVINVYEGGQQVDPDEVRRRIDLARRLGMLMTQENQEMGGIGVSFEDAGNTHHVNPAFLVATARHESSFGIAGWAWSHVEEAPHNPMGWSIVTGQEEVDWVTENHPRGNAFDTWEAGIEHLAQRIAESGIYYPTLTTVDEIRRKYAGQPATAAIVGYMNALAKTAKQAGKYHENFSLYIDPAGYIYDVATGERISGASVWLQRPDGQGGWENVSAGQTPPVMQPDVNPLFTGADGQYQWDVLAGSYRVHVEAAGYYSVDSIVVIIPPPVTDLHVGLTNTTPPTIPAGEEVPWVWVCVGIAVVVIIAVVILILIRKGK